MRLSIYLGAAIALMAGIGSLCAWSYHRGAENTQAKCDAKAAQLALRRTQQYVDHQVRVHQTDVDNAGIMLHIELQLQMQRQQLPQVLEESRHAIANAPALRTCRLPAALFELRKQQVARSAEIAADTAGSVRQVP